MANLIRAQVIYVKVCRVFRSCLCKVTLFQLIITVLARHNHKVADSRFDTQAGNVSLCF